MTREDATPEPDGAVKRMRGHPEPITERDGVKAVLDTLIDAEGIHEAGLARRDGLVEHTTVSDGTVLGELGVMTASLLGSGTTITQSVFDDDPAHLTVHADTGQIAISSVSDHLFLIVLADTDTEQEHVQAMLQDAETSLTQHLS